MNDSALVEAFARLKSLRQNLSGPYVAVKYVSEFHEILDLLEGASGASLKNFRIPSSEVRPVVVASNYLDGSEEYSKEPYCDLTFFRMKVEAVLNMFEIAIGTKPGPIALKLPRS